MVVIRALDMEEASGTMTCLAVVESQVGDSNIPEEDIDSLRAPCNAKI
jgi:hypothetical protein